MPKTLRGTHSAGMNPREGLSLNTPLIKRLMRRRSPTLTPSTGAIDMEIVGPRVAMVLQDIHMPKRCVMMDRNGGSAQEGLEGPLGPLEPIL